MKVLNVVFVLLVALVLALASDAASARRGGAPPGGGRHSAGSHFAGSHSARGHPGGFHPGGFHSRARVGVFVGAPLFAYGYYPYYDYWPIYSAPLATEYIEKEPAARSASDYWYYCPGSAMYYPYAQQCPEGWQAVEPVPPAS